MRAQLASRRASRCRCRRRISTQRGHAIECRVYAEDSGARLPAAGGTLLRYREPRGPRRPRRSRRRRGRRRDRPLRPAAREAHRRTADSREPRIARLRCGAARDSRSSASRTNLRFLLTLLDAPEFRERRDRHALHRGASRRLGSRRVPAAPRRSRIAGARRAGGESSGAQLDADDESRAACDPWLTLGRCAWRRRACSAATLATACTTWTADASGTRRDRGADARRGRRRQRARRIDVRGASGATPSAARRRTATRLGHRRRRSLRVHVVRGRAGRRGGRDQDALSPPMPATWSADRASSRATGSRRAISLVVLEAMKMELPMRAAARRRRHAVPAAEGELVQPGDSARRAWTHEPSRRHDRRSRSARRPAERSRPRSRRRDKIAFVDLLSAAGLPAIEVSAFVSPKWVPQMADAAEVFAGITRRPGVAVHGARAELARARARARRRRRRGGDLRRRVGDVQPAQHQPVHRRRRSTNYRERHARRPRAPACACAATCRPRSAARSRTTCPSIACIDLRSGCSTSASTRSPSATRSASPIRDRCARVLDRAGRDASPPASVALHFHDTRGTALANVLASLDSASRLSTRRPAGSAGCPYAPGAAGNLATEDLVYMLDGLGIETGVELERVMAASAPLETAVGHRLPSRYLQASRASRAGTLP